MSVWFINLILNFIHRSFKIENISYWSSDTNISLLFMVKFSRKWWSSCEYQKFSKGLTTSVNTMTKKLSKSNSQSYKQLRLATCVSSVLLACSPAWCIMDGEVEGGGSLDCIRSHFSCSFLKWRFRVLSLSLDSEKTVSDWLIPSWHVAFEDCK